MKARMWNETGVIETRYVSSPPITLPNLLSTSILSIMELGLLVEVVSSIELSLSATL